MKVGDSARRTREVEAEDVVRFTEMSGDRNPLHYDADVAHHDHQPARRRRRRRNGRRLYREPLA